MDFYTREITPTADIPYDLKRLKPYSKGLLPNYLSFNLNCSNAQSCKKSRTTYKVERLT